MRGRGDGDDRLVDEGHRDREDHRDHHQPGAGALRSGRLVGPRDCVKDMRNVDWVPESGISAKSPVPLLPGHCGISTDRPGRPPFRVRSSVRMPWRMRRMLFRQAGQLGMADAAVLAAASGSPTVVVVEGDEGTGKDARSSTSWPTGPPVSTCWMRAASRAPPSILFGHPRAVGRRSTGWDPPPTSTCSSARSSSTQLLDRHADGGPVLLRLDDLQWADRDSVEALTWMLQRASGDRLLGRDGQPPDGVDDPSGLATLVVRSGAGDAGPRSTGLPLRGRDARLLRRRAARPERRRPSSGSGSTRREPVVPRRASCRVRRCRPRRARQWLPAPRAFAEAIELRSSTAVRGRPRPGPGYRRPGHRTVLPRLPDAGAPPRHRRTPRTPPRSWRARACSRSAPRHWAPGPSRITRPTCARP